jgi:ferredoxin--NADP+ reductase
VLDGASRSWELGYAAEMERAARQVSWLKYVSTVSRPWEDEKWTGETGRVDDVVRKYADLWKLSPRDTKIYLCGHPGMIENVRGIALRGGWNEKNVEAEAFFVPARNVTSARA